MNGDSGHGMWTCVTGACMDTFLYTVDRPAAFLRIIPGNMVWAGDTASVTPRKCRGMEMNLE